MAQEQVNKRQDVTIHTHGLILIVKIFTSCICLLSVKALRLTLVSVVALLTAMLTELFTITLTPKDSSTYWMETKLQLSSALSSKSC